LIFGCARSCTQTASVLAPFDLDRCRPDADKGSWVGPSGSTVLKEKITMAAVCQVTGAVPGFGHNISHSHRRTKRRFDPNVQKKTYYVPSLGRKITINVSAKGIKVIDARGIESVVKDMIGRGVKI
jgi:large subunit ribosomal protein L28